MHRLEWNALQVGDTVLVHDPSSAALELVPGLIAMLNAAEGPNHIGIRIAATDGSSTVICPPRQAVHLRTTLPTAPCWRCSSLRPAA